MRQPVPFGKYLLLDRISVGGMAEVFKAKSYGVEGFEKIIAIKRILPTMGEDRDFIKMFIDEAKIAGQLAHANICQIFELGRIDGSHFIAMEYIWGKDLLQIQNRCRKVKQSIPVTLACFVIAKVLEGLDYAHRKRDPLGRPLEIVHRDCSPQNVLVSYEGEVKVIDFGIAKATSRNSRTMAGVLKGKFGYMSPEQVRGLPLDRRSDIFALGTMLYECLTGERLFQGETDFSTLEKVRNVDIQPPRALNPNIPEAVERVILKALAKDVDDRYQWCSEMLADLQQYLMSQDVVFTAKSLSAWLKDMFNAEIERERQQLEQYKRVGRDGLIAGVPAAEAKLDVVEHLGEAGAPEGDATTLGGPSFDDIEQNLGARSDVALAPTPAAPRQTPRPDAKSASRPIARPPSEDDDGDFENEAPTEIFGDGDVPVPVAPPMAAAGGPPSTRPPRPPPRAGTGQRSDPPPMGDVQRAPTGSLPAMARTPTPHNVMPMAQASPPSGYPSQLPGMPPQQQPQYAPQMSPSGPMAAQMPMSSSQPMPMQSGLSQPGMNSPQRTVIGIAAPPGLPNYGGNYARPSQPPPMQNGPMPNGMMPGQPAPYGYPSYPPQGYGMPGMMPDQMGMQNQSGMVPAAAAIDPLAPQVEQRRSTLVRDIFIGVLIATFVLGGFLVVKLVILDKDSSPASSGSGAPGGSTIATLKVALPAGVHAQLFLDGKKHTSDVAEGSNEIPVTAGVRKIKIVGSNGKECEVARKLDANQTTTIDCLVTASAAGSGASASTGSGSAGSASASGLAGSASTQVAAVKPPETKPAEVKDTKPTDTKDTKPVETKPVETKKDTKPAEVKDTKPVETKKETKPAETKPVETKKETKPADTKIAATKPADTKPADTKPADTKKTTTKGKTEAKVSKDKPADAPADTADTAGPKGFVQIYSKPPAKILVDGAATNRTTPIEKLALSPGKHKITYVTGDGRYSYTVMIKPGETTKLEKDLE